MVISRFLSTLAYSGYFWTSFPRLRKLHDETQQQTWYHHAEWWRAKQKCFHGFAFKLRQWGLQKLVPIQRNLPVIHPSNAVMTHIPQPPSRDAFEDNEGVVKFLQELPINLVPWRHFWHLETRSLFSSECTEYKCELQTSKSILRENLGQILT